MAGELGLLSVLGLGQAGGASSLPIELKQQLAAAAAAAAELPHRGLSSGGGGEEPRPSAPAASASAGMSAAAAKLCTIPRDSLPAAAAAATPAAPPAPAAPAHPNPFLAARTAAAAGIGRAMQLGPGSGSPDTHRSEQLPWPARVRAGRRQVACAGCIASGRAACLSCRPAELLLATHLPKQQPSPDPTLPPPCPLGHSYRRHQYTP